MYSHYAAWKARQVALVPADTTPTPTIVSVLSGVDTLIGGSGFMAARPRADAGTSFVEAVYFGLVAVPFVVNSEGQIAADAEWNGTDPVVVHTSGGCATFGATAASPFTGQLGTGRSAPSFIVLGLP